MPQEKHAADSRDLSDGLSPQARQAYEELVGRAPETKIQARLEAMRMVMDLLGNPQHSYPVIHIAGTNGKTSTARMVEAGLRASGLRTGRFISPHLTKFTERISIDGVAVSDDMFVRVWNEVKPYIEIVDKQLTERGQPTLTFFEALTAAAFVIFAEVPVDALVLEVGLGGVTDATNVADADVAVLMPVSLDHTEILGDGIADIAGEKAGIIKPGSYVVSAWQEDEATAVIAARARELDNWLAWERRDFSVCERRVAVGGQIVDVQGVAGQYPGVPLPLHGAHQAQNLSVAIAALEAFIGGGRKPLGSEVIGGMSRVISSPGRLEVVHTQPLVIVDAAHNPAGARACAEAVREVFDFSGILVLGILEAKDSRSIVQTFLDILGDRITAWCFTQSSSFRAVPASALARDALSWGVPEGRASVEQDLAAALRQAMTEASGRPDASGKPQAVLVTGSVTLAAQARLILGAKDSSDDIASQGFAARDIVETPQLSGPAAAFLSAGRQDAVNGDSSPERRRAAE